VNTAFFMRIPVLLREELHGARSFALCPDGPSGCGREADQVVGYTCS
jgi:hypothetical protein